MEDDYIIFYINLCGIDAPLYLNCFCHMYIASGLCREHLIFLECFICCFLNSTSCWYFLFVLLDLFFLVVKHHIFGGFFSAGI